MVDVVICVFVSFFEGSMEICWGCFNDHLRSLIPSSENYAQTRERKTSVGLLCQSHTQRLALSVLAKTACKHEKENLSVEQLQFLLAAKTLRTNAVVSGEEEEAG